MVEITVEDILRSLRQQVEMDDRSQKTVAFDLGVSPQCLNNILQGRRDPGAKVLKAMGIRKRISYEVIR